MSRLELYHDVEKRRAAFAFNLSQSQVYDIFQQIVDERINAPDLTVENVLEEYLLASKKLGDVDKDELTFYVLVCLTFGKDLRVPREFKAEAFEYAASMLWETAFIDTVDSHNSPATVDSRIELIDTGSSLLQHAATFTQKDDMERTQRLLIKNLFTQVMRDIVAGEVTRDTRDELLLSIRDARSQLKFIPDYSRRNGLLGELLVLETYWLAYQGQGDKVAVPATVRGGNGRFNRNETHDLDILRQRHDDSWIVLTPVEVKNRKITDEIRDRYTKSHLAVIATNGNVTIDGSHRDIAG